MKTAFACLMACVSLLLLEGILMLDSALVYEVDPARLRAHAQWIALGLTAGVILSLAPMGWWRRPVVLYSLTSLAILLLALVLIPGVGTVRNGARRWLLFGQPSELAKIVLILALADYGARHQPTMANRGLGLLKPGLLVLTMAGLVFFEEDWGNAILICLIAYVLLGVAGAHWGYLISCGLIGGLAGALLLLRNSMRLDRVLAFIDPEAYQWGSGFQQWRSILAIALGGLWGQNPGEGLFKAGFVPEQETDFIFSLIGEETGFVGCLWVLALYAGILALGSGIAWRMADPYAKLVVVGVTFLICLQAFINLGVAACLLPNKGLPLPFISYGGSNMVSLLSGLGIMAGIIWRPSDGSH